MACGRHLRLYLWKNVLFKSRNLCSTICELCTPLVIVCLMALLFLLSHLDVVPTQTFQDKSITGDFIPLAILPQKLRHRGWDLAVVGDDDIVDPFLASMDLYYPGINATVLFGEEFAHMDVPKFSSMVRKFPSSADVDAYVTADDYHSTKQLYAAVVFESGPPHWSYTIRMNMSSIPSTKSFTKNLARNVDETYMRQYFGLGASSDAIAAAAGKGAAGIRQLADSVMPGFVPLQLAIDKYIINSTTPSDMIIKSIEDQTALSAILLLGYLNNTGPLPPPKELLEHQAAILNMAKSAVQSPQHMSVTPFPITGYRSNNFYSAADDVFALLFTISFMGPSFWLIRALVAEKEERIREGMKMMGMTDLPLFAAWFITYGVVFFIIAMGATIICALGIFANSNFFLVFLMFFLFGLASISFSYFISAFFSRSKTAAVLGTILFLVAFFPYFSVSENTKSTAVKLLGCLLAPTSFGMSINSMAQYESQGQGVSFRNLFVIESKFSTGLALTMLLVDFVLYTLLGWYLDNVWPSEFGLRRPLWFPCTREYWLGHPADAKRSRRSKSIHAPLMGGNDSDDGSHIEMTPNALQALDAENRCLKLEGLSKVFSTPDGPRTAVNHLNFTMYESQIFVLLGHNGAGKTTTMNMLNGLISPSSGTARVYGKDIRTDMNDIRHSMGVCPQHDVLFPFLTVKEHLQFFAGLKGVDKAQVAAKVAEAIQEVGLTEKVNVRSAALSGGMKRKLSLAIALIGDSKVVFLDEPTSGMDPYSRRSTWNIIKNNREGRIIVLTTHFMEEADLLGDRIAIMAAGTLRCLGSSRFLKEQYGVGYHLTMVKQDGCSASALKNLVRDHVPEAKVLSDVGAEFSMQLPFTASAAFPDLFDKLDHDKDRLRLETYGIGVTTLEEVFLKVAREGNAHEQKLTRQASERLRAKSTVSQRVDREGRDVEGGGGGGAGDGVGFGSSSAAASMARAAVAAGAGAGAYHAPRDHAGRSTSGGSEMNTLVGGGSGAGAGGAGGAVVRDAAFDQYFKTAHRSMFWPHFKALFVKRFWYTLRDKRACCFQLLIPVLALTVGLWLLKSALPVSEPKYVLSPAEYNLIPGKQSAQLPHFNDMPYNNTAQASSVMMEIPAATGDPIKVDGVRQYLPDGGAHFANPLNNTSDDVRAMSEYLLATKNDRKASRYGAYMVQEAVFGPEEGPEAGSYMVYNVLQNTTSYHATPLFTNIMNSAIYRKVTGGGGASITAATHPLPLTQSQRAGIAIGSAVFAVIIISVAFAFIPASFAVFVVKERGVNAKHQQLISGVSISAYWLSTFVWDVCAYMVPCGLSLLIVYLFKIQNLISADAFPVTAVVFITYGTSVAANTYIFTYFFKSHSTAQNVVLLVNLMVFLMLLVSIIMGNLEKTCETNAVLVYFFRLFPGFTLGHALINLSTIQLLPFLQTDCGKIPFEEAANRVFKPMDLSVAGTDVYFLIGMTVVYLVIAILIDVMLSYPSIRAWVFKDRDVKDPPNLVMDEDVAAEAQRVTTGGADNDIIQLNGVRKVYGGRKVAVGEMTFGIPRGQCFGFLGINGAGKTSTLKILSGDLIPTRGTAKLGGFDILKQQVLVRRLLGYCPQFDALLDLLTVREHLELYARIKGVPEGAPLCKVVDAKIRELQLDDFEHKYAGTLSGGNKRKLSVAIAMIGDPPILFLDEPSTGMDPMARRFMWDVISRVSSEKKQCSIILTTHSMEECEALCSRVGIAVGGRLQCLGSVQHLKQRFGRGYLAELTLSEASEADVDYATHILAQGELLRDGDQSLHWRQLAGACQVLGDPDRQAMVHEHSSGWLLAARFKADGKVPTRMFTEWWAAESRAAALHQFVSTHFVGAQLVERHDLKFRYKLADVSVPIGQLFRIVEEAKAKLRIREYSLSQTSLEQIFNWFAAQQQQETGPVRGITGGTRTASLSIGSAGAGAGAGAGNAAVAVTMESPKLGPRNAMLQAGSTSSM